MIGTGLKGALKSKTVWFGTAVTLSGLVMAIAQPFIAPELYGAITTIIGGIVVILRYLTDSPLSDK